MNIRYFSGIAAALLTTGIFVGDANASHRGVPAMQGFGWPNSARTCFSTAWEDATNTCTTEQTFLIPLLTETPNAVAHRYNISVFVVGNNTDKRVKCKAIVNDNNNNGRFTGTAQTTSPITTLNTLNLGEIDVHDGNTIHVECSVKAGGTVRSVFYGLSRL